MATTLTDYILFLSDLILGRRTQSELSAAKLRQAHCGEYLDFSSSLKILDLANGRLRPQLSILKRQGHKVLGIDLVNKPELSINNFLYFIARNLFQAKLPHGKGVQSNNNLVFGNVGSLPFASNTFDLVTSIAAFEHFSDVPTVVSEVKRVLRPGGLVWVSIHVFTTLSGGHNVGMRLSNITQLPKGTDPWDHLRRRRIPFSVPLNELRINQYIECFQRHFNIIRHQPLGCEGKDLLTEEILEELKDYSRDELTCGHYLIVAQKL